MDDNDDKAKSGDAAQVGPAIDAQLDLVKSLATENDSLLDRLRGTQIPQHIGMAAAGRALAADVPRALMAQVQADLTSGALGKRWEAALAHAGGENGTESSLAGLAMLLIEQARATGRYLSARGEGRSAGQWQKRSRLFVASSALKKNDDVEWIAPDAASAVQSPTRLSVVLDKRIPLLKTGEERYVLGVVLEPETVDAQSDIYSAAEVREAAHRFMEEYQNVGLMHRDLVNGKVKILESYVAPAPFELDGTKVRKGTWLLAVRVLDDELWGQIKAGELTGFSIGGSAVRNPE